MLRTYPVSVVRIKDECSQTVGHYGMKDTGFLGYDVMYYGRHVRTDVSD